ncbi:MAG: glycosyltransferase family 2 protein [Candidatus Eremiobacteraeota bacterium]|nr:glycosyltransferase family 2 protein [Candidatus Eremiobacteraeota bacterium]
MQATRPSAPASGPLVSVVVPTYNRRDDLVNNALQSLFEQKYRNIEILIVNDAGEKIADLAALDPRIRTFDREVNAGTGETINYGARQATGKYLQFLADDDRLYPDHILRLVEALERTGCGVAHGNTLIRYERPAAGGGWETVGYNAAIFCAPTDSEEVLASSPVAGQALMYRLDLMRELGFYRDVLLADQELQIRLLQRTDFVHVDRFTNEWLIRDQGHNLARKATKDVPAGLAAMYALHPSENQFVVVNREQTMKNIKARPEGFAFPPVVSIKGFEL